MAVTIRLMRFGKKGYPTYRIVLMDKKRKRNSSYLEKIGFYNPNTNPATILINEEKLSFWKSKGAVISEGLRKLLLKKTKKGSILSDKS